MTASDEGQVVLVTGASSGIGLATAVRAASAGWRTVATVRDDEGERRLSDAAAGAGVSVEVRRLEITDAAAVASCIEEVVRAHGRLDVLVNNAGAASVGTVETLPLEAFRQSLEVNFFGVLGMTRAALPHLRATGGRVLTVTSVGGVVGQPFNDAYCAAKFAVEGLMESLAPVAAAVGVAVCVIEPGAVASSFIDNARVDPGRMLAEAGPYEDVLGSYLARVMSQFSTAAQPPPEVAAVIVDALSSAPLPFRIQTSASAAAFTGVKLADLDGSRVQALTGGWLTA